VHAGGPRLRSVPAQAKLQRSLCPQHPPQRRMREALARCCRACERGACPLGGAGAPLGFCGEPSHKCRLCRFMALSWHNLPCALTPAIGIGKQTLGDPASRRRPWLPRTPSVVRVAPRCKILARDNKTGRHVFAYVPDAEERPWRPLASPLAAPKRGRSLCRRRAAMKIPLFVAATAVVLLATGACWND
jgi:hypothetical protein